MRNNILLKHLIMTKLKLSLIFLFLVFSAGLFSQQSREISGKVIDASSKSPLIGATIIVKGTSGGAISDPNGFFKYTVNSRDIENAVLMVSYIGYESQTIKIKDQNYFEIYLTEDVNSLEEVVVTSSYGTKKLRQEVVGSISNIKTQDLITEQSVTSFDELLEGQTAGVYIESGAEVGAPVNIHVRGQGSLTPLSNNSVGSSTQPLIIVDGVILAEEVSLDGNSFFDAGDGLYSENMMNPLAKVGIKDIESINILKDAAAVSLYGADGANGVIVITTKGGKKGPLKYNFTAQGGVSSAMNRIKYMNGEQYQEIRNYYYLNSGQPNNVSEWNGVNTDWFDLLNRTGTFQNYDISAAGGTDLINFRFSFGYQNMQEPQIENDFIKYNGGVSLSYKKKKLNASIKFSPSYTIKNSPNTFYSFAVPPTIAPYDSSGNYTRFDTYGNPLAVAKQNRGLVETKALLSSYNLSYDIMEGFNFSTLFGLDFSNKDQDTFFSGLNETGIDNYGNLGNRLLRERITRRWNWNAKLSYEKQFNENHYFDALLGIETRQNTVEYSYARGENFPDPGAIQDISLATEQDYEEDRSETSGRSMFSQVNYDFQKNISFWVTSESIRAPFLEPIIIPHIMADSGQAG
jgi:TonB-linked SusC/RagA family outer membrane protein